MVQISELDLFDAEGQTILRDLHFRLNRGEWACIIGQGVETSSLLQLICGLLRPKGGQILVDDRNVIRLSPERLRELRRRMGIVLKDEVLPGRGTLQDRLIFKLRALDFPYEEASRRAGEALESVELRERAQCLPCELNGLERQLFKVGLAISHEPVLLLLEEPLEGLTPEEAERFLEVLKRLQLRKRLTILMTTTTTTKAYKMEKYPVRLYELKDGSLQSLMPSPAAEAEVDLPR